MNARFTKRAKDGQIIVYLRVDIFISSNVSRKFAKSLVITETSFELIRQSVNDRRDWSHRRTIPPIRGGKRRIALVRNAYKEQSRGVMSLPI